MPARPRQNPPLQPRSGVRSSTSASTPTRTSTSSPARRLDTLDSSTVCSCLPSLSPSHLCDWWCVWCTPTAWCSRHVMHSQYSIAQPPPQQPRPDMPLSRHASEPHLSNVRRLTSCATCHVRCWLLPYTHGKVGMGHSSP